MKWYFVLLIIVGAIVVTVIVARLVTKTEFQDQISCRPGTCLGTRTDGTQWCSSAFCKKAVTETSFISPQGFRQVNYTPSPIVPGLP